MQLWKGYLPILYAHVKIKNMMSNLFKTVAMVGTLILSIYIATIGISPILKFNIWFFCLLIILSIFIGYIIDLLKSVEENSKSRIKQKTDDYYYTKLEIIDLRGKGFSDEYIESLGKLPEINHFYLNAIALKNKGQLKEAIIEFKNCINHPRCESRARIHAYLQIGECYAEQSEFKLSKRNFKKSLRLTKEIESKETRKSARAGVLNDLGHFYLMQGKPKKALFLIKKAYKINTVLKNEKEIADNLGNMGLVYQHLGKYKKALSSFDEAYKIEIKIKNAVGASSDLTNIGLILNDMGCPRKAIRCFLDSARIDKGIGMERHLGGSLGNIGMTLIYIRKARCAIQFLKKSLELEKEKKRGIGIGNALNGLGIAYAELGEKDIARNCFTQALKNDETIGYKEGQARDMANLGVFLYNEYKDSFSALQYLEGSLKISKSIKDMIKVNEIEQHIHKIKSNPQ